LHEESTCTIQAYFEAALTASLVAYISEENPQHSDLWANWREDADLQSTAQRENCVLTSFDQMKRLVSPPLLAESSWLLV